ncbi:hypothetical protein FH608_040570 [Nonomuraea phyllanthi]|uniref:Uncharacterized protein n=1 Tax=Nonomuraea phyllanthi TaxID=2219224 RepID=A0A5C4VIZ6_9ACTN|nr:hypothetical protein [Nonomuraea phyllanthi]KAB8189142.1 hypothetical protein FH608_040570 [Nonomuraea phyllanthi]QFY10233.1 hypothetical protein GBF35_29605 [Nonomuraea phyllanthi]
MRPPATDQPRAVLPDGHDLAVRHCVTVADLTRQPFIMWTAGGEPLIMTRAGGGRTILLALPADPLPAAVAVLQHALEGMCGDL